MIMDKVVKSLPHITTVHLCVHLLTFVFIYLFLTEGNATVCVGVPSAQRMSAEPICNWGANSAQQKVSVLYLIICTCIC